MFALFQCFQLKDCFLFRRLSFKLTELTTANFSLLYYFLYFMLRFILLSLLEQYLGHSFLKPAFFCGVPQGSILGLLSFSMYMFPLRSFRFGTTLVSFFFQWKLRRQLLSVCADQQEGFAANLCPLELVTYQLVKSLAMIWSTPLSLVLLSKPASSG